MRHLFTPGLIAALGLVLGAGCAGGDTGGPGDDDVAGDDDAAGDDDVGGDDDAAGDDDVAGDDDASDDDSDPGGEEVTVQGTVDGPLDAESLLVFRTAAGVVPVTPRGDGSFTVLIDPGADAVAWLVEAGHVTAVVSAPSGDGDHPAFATGDGDLLLVRDGARISASGAGVEPRQAASAGGGLGCVMALGACAEAMIDRADASDADGDGLADSEDLDGDGDGVPDAADPDDDGDGIFDSLDRSGPSFAAPLPVAAGEAPEDGGEPPPEGPPVEAEMSAFTNLKLDGMDIDPDPIPEDGDSWPYSERVVLTLEWRVPADLAGTIRSVTASTLPFVAADATVAPGAGGSFVFTGVDAASTYPAAGGAWDGALRRAESGADEVWTVWVLPGVDLMSGDMLVFQVEADAGTSYRTSLVDFPLRTPPLMDRAESDAGPVAVTYPVADGDVGGRSNPVPFSGDLTLYGSRPRTDASGAAEAVCGMGYRADVFYLDASGAQIGGALTHPTPDAEPYPCAGEVSFTLTSADLPDEVGGTPVAGYKIDFTAVGDRGDNSSAMLHYVKVAAP